MTETAQKNGHTTPVNPVEHSPVVELDPNDVLPAPGQLPPPLERITSSGQLKSVRDIGQITDAIVYSSPDLPLDKYYCADGNGLALCMRVLGRKLRCRVLDHAPTKAELRQIRTATHFARKDKAAAQEQLETDLDEEMAESGASLTEAAATLGISPGYASKIRSDSKLIPELHHLRENKDLCRDSRRIIASMKTPELQKKLAEKALALIAQKGKAKRDTVQALAEELRDGRKPKDRPLKLRGEGIELTAKRPAVDSLRAFVEKVSSALKRMKTGEEIENIAFYFRSA